MGEPSEVDRGRSLIEGLDAVMPESGRWPVLAVAGALVAAVPVLVLLRADVATLAVVATGATVFWLLASPPLRRWWPALATPLALLTIATLTWTTGTAAGFSAFLAVVLVQEALVHGRRRIVLTYGACVLVRVGPLLSGADAGEWSRAVLDLGVWALVAAAAVAGVDRLRTAAVVAAASEHRFTSLVRATGAAVWLADASGHVLDGNDAGTELTGWTVDELRGRTLRRVCPPDRLAPDLERWRGALRGEAASYETVIVRRDGRRRDVRVTLLPLEADADGTGGFLVVAHDVTALAEAQRETARSEERFRLLADRARVGIYTARVAPVPRVEYVNATFEAMSGVPAATWYADAYAARRYVHRDDLERVLTRRRGDYRDDEEPMLYRWHHPDGTLRWHELLEVPLRGGQGEVVALQGIVNDVTDRVVEQERITSALEREQLAVERLERLHELKTTFLQSVSHELRTPLTSVLGFARTLREHADQLGPDRSRELLSRAIVNAEKLERLLRDLLDVDRLSRGAATLARQEVDLRELVHRVVAELEAGGDRVEVDVGPVVAWIDGPKVERIVENLVHNALRHTPPGTPVTVRARRWGPGGAEVVVADRGPGVPDELKQRLFEPFEQGRASATAASPGTGIGLTLVARFAELHGGSAEILDRVGGGAAFRVVLPGIPAEGAAPPTVAASDEAHQEVALLPHA